MTLRILSAPSSLLLEKEAEKYNISTLGSLAILNGNFFLAIIGEPKETPKTTKTSSAPKKTTTRKPRASKSKQAE